MRILDIREAGVTLRASASVRERIRRQCSVMELECGNDKLRGDDIADYKIFT